MSKKNYAFSPINKELGSALYISFNDFQNYEYYINEMRSRININSNCSVLVRILYKNLDDDNILYWKTLGSQIGFNNLDDNSILDSKLFKLYDVIILRLSSSMDIYRYNNNQILGLQILVYSIDKVRVARNTSITKSLKGVSDLVNVSQISKGFDRNFPITINQVELFNNRLQTVIKDSNVFIIYNDVAIDFLSRINTYKTEDKKLNGFLNNIEFYQNNFENKSYIITKELIDNSVSINVYTIDGIHIQHMIDTHYTLDSFKRQIGNVIFYIDYRGIYNKKTNIKFPHVFKRKLKGRYTSLMQPDYKFGSLDLETFIFDGISRTYAIGFHADNTTKLFYIDQLLDFDSLIEKCLDNMLIDKFNGYTFYVHNLGNYDVVYLLKVLSNITKKHPGKYEYKNNIIFRDDKVLSLDISTVKGKTKYTIKIVDSINLLSSSLSKLCNTFKTEIKKSYFPYNFVSKNTLFYVGDKPNISYYNNISIEDYNTITNNWSLRDETLMYLSNDVVALHEVMKKFITSIYINYHTHVTKSLTISSLSMDIFLSRYYDNNIPLIKQKSIYYNIKNSYFGGITEVYKPYGRNLYYYDVNSLYPYSALNPMPGMNCIYTDNINKNISDIIKDLFGFYYCKIKTSNNYIGLLPYRDSKGLLMPEGEFEGWYFSEELKFAYEHGYQITVLHGYDFDKNHNVFSKYVNHLYQIKMTTKDSVEKALAKSMLNNLLGRFGLDINKYITRIVTEEDFKLILQTNKVRSIKYMDQDNIIVSYDKDPSQEICKSHDIDYNDLLSDIYKGTVKGKLPKQEDFKDVSIAIASAVTSYSRIYMNKIKFDILNKGGSIYYSDTDSIVTDIKLDNSFVGPEIGKFKLEEEVSEAYYISNKTYAMKNTKGDIIIKTKGIDSKSLKYEDIKNLYLGKEVEGIRFESHKDYFNGSVIINKEQKITLSPYSYTKRVKVYENNVWVNTKPINIGSKSNYHTQQTDSSNIISKTKVDVNKSSLYKYIFISYTSVIIFILITMFIFCLFPLNSIEIPMFINTEDILIYNKIEYDSEVTNYNEELYDKRYNEKKNIVIQYIDRLIHNTGIITDYKINNIYETRTIKPNVLDGIVSSHIENLNKEIESLRESLSLKEIELLNTKVEKLNIIQKLDFVIKDINKNLRSPLSPLSPRITFFAPRLRSLMNSPVL